MYDLLLKGASVVDPSQGLSRLNDIAVAEGLIAKISPSIPAKEALRVVDIGGLIATPGLIDLHVHVYEGVTGIGLSPDVAGVRAGVTTMVDAGSAGCATFAGIPRYVIPDAHTEIICFLHISRTGLATSPDIFSPECIDVEETVRVAQQYHELIRGIKARMVSPALEIMGMEMPRLAKRAASESGTSLMVHIGDTEHRYDPNVIRELLPILGRGDIVTHFLTANPGGILDAAGKLAPEVKEAMDRGVWMDASYGRRGFSFEVANRAADQGVIPHTISTDMTAPGRSSLVYSLTEMMTRFLALGYTLEQVVSMCTANPAQVIGEAHRLGGLAVGRQADISVLALREGDWLLTDAVGDTLRTDRAIVPALTLKRGDLFEPDWGPHPWGWEPNPSGA